MRRQYAHHNVPWITKDGWLDVARLPIDSILDQTLADDIDTFRSGCTMLQTMHRHGRTDAGIYLLGLLRHFQNDHQRLTIIVESLGGFETEACVDALFAELKRVKSSNTTRTYLNTVIEVLSFFHIDMIKPRFEDLAQDSYFSNKMRRKFEEALDNMWYRSSEV